MTGTILFYDDATEFGGHEKMTVALIRQMFRYTGYRVAFVHADANHRLVQALNVVGSCNPGRLTLHPVPFRSGKIPTLEIFWQFHQIVALARLFNTFSPDFAVIAQGNIELSVKGLVASRYAGIKAVSYLPYVYCFADLPGSPAGRFRDWYNRLFFNMAFGFIVITDSCRHILVSDYGVAPSSIFLVRNLLNSDKMVRYSRNEARERLGLSMDAVIVTVIGRTYFRTKGQDFTINALREMLGDDLRLMIVGDGPDRDALLDLARDEIAAGTVIVKEWLDDPSAAYCASDLILMPSTLEGVPLVLLEALYFEKMVLASDIPPFDEYLPQAQRFTMGDADALRRCVADALKNLDSQPSSRERVAAATTVDSDVNRESILALLGA